MTIIQLYNKSVSISEIRSSIEGYLTTKINANQDVFESLTRMGNHYGGNIFPSIYYTTSDTPSNTRWSHNSTYQMPPQEAGRESIQPEIKNRYSVVYLFKDQYKHVVRTTREQALADLSLLLDDRERTPVGIYDDKTELFEWDHSLREEYEKASMWEQGRRGEEVIEITKALRRRDISWDSGELQRPTFFA